MRLGAPSLFMRGSFLTKGLPGIFFLRCFFRAVISTFGFVISLFALFPINSFWTSHATDIYTQAAFAWNDYDVSCSCPPFLPQSIHFLNPESKPPVLRREGAASPARSRRPAKAEGCFEPDMIGIRRRIDVGYLPLSIIDVRLAPPPCPILSPNGFFNLPLTVTVTSLIL